MKKLLSVIMAVAILFAAIAVPQVKVAAAEKGYIHIFYKDKSGNLNIVWKLEVEKDATVTVPETLTPDFDPQGKLGDIDDLQNITGIIAIIYKEDRDGDAAPADLQAFYNTLKKEDTYQTGQFDGALWLYEDPAGGSPLSGSLNIEAMNVKVKSIAIKNAPKTLEAGKSVTLKAVVTPKDATLKKVTWTSSNKKFATVNKKGVVTAKAPGKGKTVKITAKAADDSGVKKTVKIKIK